MSERYRELTDGDITIPLIAVSGLAPSGNVHQRDINIVKTISETAVIPESYTMNVVGMSTEELGVKCQQFINLLKKASNYKKTFWQRTPVYFKEKLKCEENPRFALCYGPAGLNYSDLFEDVTEFQNVIINMGIVLVREHPWRSEIPGILPAAKTLTASDGPASPTKVVVANFRDNNIGITHI
jgi:hypothetical protein